MQSDMALSTTTGDRQGLAIATDNLPTKFEVYLLSLRRHVLSCYNDTFATADSNRDA